MKYLTDNIFPRLIKFIATTSKKEIRFIGNQD